MSLRFKAMEPIEQAGDSEILEEVIKNMHFRKHLQPPFRMQRTIEVRLSVYRWPRFAGYLYHSMCKSHCLENFSLQENADREVIASASESGYQDSHRKGWNSLKIRAGERSFSSGMKRTDKTWKPKEDQDGRAIDQSEIVLQESCQREAR